MRRNYFSNIEMAGCLLIGGAIITSIVYQTFFTFMLGCTAWVIVLTSMIYNEIKTRKRAKILNFRDYFTQSPDSAEDHLSPKVQPQRASHKAGLKETPVALVKEENFENSLSPAWK